MPTKHIPKKASYGLDAPGVIRNLLIAFLVSLAFSYVGLIHLGQVVIEPSGFVWMSLSFLVGALWMIVYSLYGKLLHRDRMLNLITWTGNEHVLDVGTGKGLLMIGAAKRLTIGRATGIDIWNSEDLTSNNAGNALNNARAEGVLEKVEIFNENAIEMSFPDESFDVIMSNECIHNIYIASGREEACKEIVRVLRKGGTAIISDHRHVADYQRYFEKFGLKTKMYNKNYIAAYPTLRILYVRKQV